MSTVIKRNESHEENFSYYRYVVKGTMYRVQIVAYDYEDTEGSHFFAWVLPQSYHKKSSYRNCGNLIYRGVSLKECWEECESYVGENPIPDTLKQLQPFIAQQT